MPKVCLGINYYSTTATALSEPFTSMLSFFVSVSIYQEFFE